MISYDNLSDECNPFWLRRDMSFHCLAPINKWQRHLSGNHSTEDWPIPNVHGLCSRGVVTVVHRHVIALPMYCTCTHILNESKWSLVTSQQHNDIRPLWCGLRSVLKLETPKPSIQPWQKKAVQSQITSCIGYNVICVWILILFMTVWVAEYQ